MQGLRTGLVATITCLSAAMTASAHAGAPRLVLQITVDGFRTDMLMRSIEHCGEGGLRMLVDDGALFVNAHYRHANTETIVGHSTLATGAQPSVHGMTGNVWYDAEADELSYNIEDPEHPLLPTGDDDRVGDQIDPAQRLARTKGRSPRALLAETFADRLLAFTGGKAKVFGVSGKDRSAVAMAGHGGMAYWYSTDNGDFVTSTYYTDAYPNWVQAWNDADHADAFADTEWTLLHERSTYDFAHQDDRPYEMDLGGFGRIFQHQYAPVGNPLFYTQVLISPAGDRLLADFAKHLIDNEAIGQDEVTDYLSVSFSGVDATNHFFGASSLENEDIVRHLDRTLANLLAHVDEAIGLEHTLIVLSADHGMAEAPEYMAERGFNAARLTTETVTERVNAFALEQFGIEGIVKFNYRPFLYLEEQRIAGAGLDFVEVREAIAATLTNAPGIHLAVSRDGLDRLPESGLTQRIRNNLHPQRSGDIYVVQDPYWFNFEEGPIAVMHGSPWAYDTHVPILFAGPGIPSGVVARSVQPADVAPTLATLLGMSPPASAQGEPLHEIIDGERK